MTALYCRSALELTLKRVFEIFLAGIVIIVASPLLLFAAIGIKLASDGPIFYQATRVGKGGVSFSMLKLRTMHIGSDGKSAITAPDDNRVFRFGAILRKLKIDELPQFWNMLIGDISLVGPRPEDPKIVNRDYNEWMLETLEVAPGITGPGSVYGYIYGENLLDDADPEGSYALRLLPPKLALERAYIDRASLFTDFQYVILTVWAILGHAMGKRVGLPRADIDGALKWAPQGPYPSDRA